MFAIYIYFSSLSKSRRRRNEVKSEMMPVRVLNDEIDQENENENE